MATKRGPPNKAAGTARGPPPAAVAKAAQTSTNNNNAAAAGIDAHPLQLKLSQQNGMHIELGGPNPLHIQLAGPNDGHYVNSSASSSPSMASAAAANGRSANTRQSAQPDFASQLPGTAPNWYQQLQVAAAQSESKRGGGGGGPSDNMDTQLTLNANGTITVARHGLSHPGHVFHISQSGGQHHITLDTALTQQPSTHKPQPPPSNTAAPQLSTAAPQHHPLLQHPLLPSASQAAGFPANFPLGFPFHHPPGLNQYTQQQHQQQFQTPPPLPFHPGMFLAPDNLIVPPMKKVNPKRRLTNDGSKTSPLEKSTSHGAKDISIANTSNPTSSPSRDGKPFLPEFEPYSYRDWLALKQRDGSMRLPSSLGANETEAWKQKVENGSERRREETKLMKFLHT